MTNPEYSQIETVVDIHPLDELGAEINLLLEGDDTQQSNQSICRRIQLADVAIYLRRYEDPPAYSVSLNAIDRYREVLVAKFEWGLLDPGQSYMTTQEMGTLAEVLLAAKAKDQEDKAKKEEATGNGEA
jgi:hypothetical protein